MAFWIALKRFLALMKKSIDRFLGVVGPFPPPRHGVSNVNEAFADRAELAGLRVLRFNTAPSSLSRSLSVRFGRLSRIVNALVGLRRFVRAHRGSPIYISLSGSWGLLYEASFAGFARMFGARLVLHHHSFRYLDAPFWPLRLLVTISGTDALHVVLGENMAANLRSRYSRVMHTLVLSNAHFVPLRDGGRIAVGRFPRTLGYLSNLSVAKGLNDVLALAEESERRGMPYEFVVAGPFEDPCEEKAFQQRVSRLKNLRYLGPIYGQAKEAFFIGVDVFLFPTRYRHEAEPLVVLEALSFGRPVIAYARGCIPSILASPFGAAVPSSVDFTEAALSALELWSNAGFAFPSRGVAAARRFEELRRESQHRYQDLLTRLAVL